MDDKQQQQQDEIDLLQSIIDEKMKILETSPYKILMKIKSDLEKNNMEFNLTVTLNDEYPDTIPKFELIEIKNYFPSKILKELNQKIIDLCNEYIGMPMLYQMYEFVLQFCDEEEKKIKLNNKK